MLGGTAHVISGSGGSLSSQGVGAEIVYSGTDTFTFISTYNRYGYIYDDLQMFVETTTPVLNVQYPINYIKEQSGQSEYYDGTERYYANMQSSYVIFTRYDAAVISGSFYFVSLPVNGKTISLSEGWFDIQR
ncbi:MAG TPA: hypothetical protein VIN07_11100 [Flavipsychrobacter sp.]